jgi:hypothetical protein
MNELCFLIGGFILLIILRTLVSHFYYKKKQELFFRSLQGKDFIVIRNTEINIEASGRTPYQHQMNKADIIFFNGHLFLLITGRLFRQAQPVLQISRIGNQEKFPYVWEEVNYISKMKVADQLRITGFSMRGTLRINYKIFINLKGTGFDLENDLTKDI